MRFFNLDRIIPSFAADVNVAYLKPTCNLLET